jgi:ubiquinone/menaquinone biosynthesis C-methylase UbiE
LTRLLLGYSAGDFSLVLKDKLQDKADITAIDPSFDKIEQAKSKSSTVCFEKSDIYNFKSNHKFDIVMFTKSLHHCNPIDKVNSQTLQ